MRSEMKERAGEDEGIVTRSESDREKDAEGESRSDGSQGEKRDV